MYTHTGERLQRRPSLRTAFVAGSLVMTVCAACSPTQSANTIPDTTVLLAGSSIDPASHRVHGTVSVEPPYPIPQADAQAAATEAANAHPQMLGYALGALIACQPALEQPPPPVQRFDCTPAILA